MANKYNLSHETQYKVISSNYLSLENGGGTSCDNCNKIITTTVLIEDTEGKQFTVGQDCALTLADIGKLDENKIKDTVKRCKKFYKELEHNMILKRKDAYILFRVVTTDYFGKPIKPFIYIPFISIEKKNLSEKFKTDIKDINWIIENYPELEDSYYIKKWKESDNRN